MPYQVESTLDMEDEDLRISVVDVYDLASEIGKEFEKIIDKFGTDTVTGLMPRVICALEHLEKLATFHESTSSYIQELKVSITQLENEKIGKAEDRQKYEKEIYAKGGEVDNIASKLEKVNQINRELRRRQRVSANQMRCLIDERAELQAKLQEEQRTTAHLRQRLGLAQKENEDLASIESVDLSNKVVFDCDDPDRPRFTMTELKEILYERNDLKARVSDLEDELQMYRPAPSSSSSEQYVHDEQTFFYYACDMCTVVTMLQFGLFLTRVFLACNALSSIS